MEKTENQENQFDVATPEDPDKLMGADEVRQIVGDFIEPEDLILLVDHGTILDAAGRLNYFQVAFRYEHSLADVILEAKYCVHNREEDDPDPKGKPSYNAWTNWKKDDILRPSVVKAFNHPDLKSKVFGLNTEEMFQKRELEIKSKTSERKATTVSTAEAVMKKFDQYMFECSDELQKIRHEGYVKLRKLHGDDKARRMFVEQMLGITPNGDKKSGLSALKEDVKASANGNGKHKQEPAKK